MEGRLWFINICCLNYWDVVFFIVDIVNCFFCVFLNEFSNVCFLGGRVLVCDDDRKLSGKDDEFWMELV